MLRDYPPLNLSRLRPGSGYAQPTQVVPERVTLDEPAESVMTDLRAVTAVIILSGDTVDEAHRRMLQRGVRLLLVIDQNRRVVGLLTATDVLGEKPMKVITERSVRREELQVRDIMTPQSELEALDLRDVRAAKVGHIVTTLQRSGRQHAIVVEQHAGSQTLCGLFSATQIARQLGVAIPTSEVARTFSEIESQLAR